MQAASASKLQVAIGCHFIYSKLGQQIAHNETERERERESRSERPRQFVPCNCHAGGVGGGADARVAYLWESV